MCACGLCVYSALVLCLRLRGNGKNFSVNFRVQALGNISRNFFFFEIPRERERSKCIWEEIDSSQGRNCGFDLERKEILTVRIIDKDKIIMQKC